MEEEQSTEKDVEVGCKQGEVDRCGTGFLDDHRHEAVEAKHTGTEANIQQPWEKKEYKKELCGFHSLSQVVRENNEESFAIIRGLRFPHNGVEGRKCRLKKQ